MASNLLSREYLATRRDPVVVASYMRSGTHLVMDFLRRNFAEIGSYKLPLEPNGNLYLPIDTLIDETWTARRARRVLDRANIPLCKTHWCSPDFQSLIDSNHPEVGEWLRARSSVIFVHRHPRKTIDSLVVWRFASGEFSAPEIPSEDWLSLRLQEWVERIRRWEATPRPLLMLSSSELINDPLSVRERFASFLNATSRAATPPLPPQLKGRWHSRANRLFGIRPTSTEILTMRPAPKIEWSDAQLDCLRKVCGPMCADLGYDL